ncbi:MAG: tRNA uridine(34) 5-carboxymethylaminomethyl modification radical SAM/GNAT enzyme Elp3 [Candidatus Bathyarchaeota archaeon]
MTAATTVSHKACQEIIKKLLKIPNPTLQNLNQFKSQVSKAHHLQSLPSNSQIIKNMKKNEASQLIQILRRKKIRTISGVAVIAVMTKPYPCPHGRCVYCPGGPTEGVPQSYTGHEPAAMRGIQNDYNPYRQVKSRIIQLREIGHLVDKVDLIIMGGNFLSTPQSYQHDFIKQCLDALNGDGESGDLEAAKKKAESGRIKNVGITVEIRPDWAKQSQINQMLNLGVTKVELGVQNPSDKIYQRVERDHTVDDVVEATRLLKDSGLKVCYHMMPGLPDSNIKKDLDSFKKIVSNPDFKPDMLKIYPCLVTRGTKLYDWWLKGEYKPYSTEEAVKLLSEVKKIIPPWIRIMRIQRDIPAKLIADGVKMGNLRELVNQNLREKGLKCKCIRCREVGHKTIKEKLYVNPKDLKLQVQKYEASRGMEAFISIEEIERDLLIGYLRLRIPSNCASRPEITMEKSAIVRELHIFGPLVPVGETISDAWQHKGYGARLLSEAERIAKEEYSCRKILVNSALGVKPYYSKFGYVDDGPYVSKSLEDD